MVQKRIKKIIRICLVTVTIVAVLFVIGILILRYQVEGETNMPFDITKISIISAVDATDNKDDTNKWNLTINQNNDIYVYLEKNNFYKKTEIIETVEIENFVINKNNQKGEGHIYKPTQKDTAIFKNSKENIANKITYTGGTESDIKKLKISNQGDLLVLRYSNDNIANYKSNDAQEVDYSKLLQNTKTTIEDLKANISFDLNINLTNGKIYKANISLDVPVDGIIENGVSNKEVTDLKDVVFKRIEK